MVNGGINKEIIYVNDYSDTLNTIGTNKQLMQMNAINQARELICDGKISEAELIMQSKANPYRYRFTPMAKIVIQSDFMFRISKYRRELRLDRAVHRLTFCTEGKNYTRESFVSGFAQVFAMKISCDSPKSINFSISYENDETDDKRKVFILGNTVCIYGNVKENKMLGLEESTDITEESDNSVQKLETAFMGILSVKNIGGTVSYIDNRINISGADEAIIYFSIRTKSFKLEKSYNIDYNDFYKQCFADVYGAQKMPYYDLINESILEHKANYEKCSVSLDDEKFGRVSTDVRLKRHFEGQSDYGLYPLMYNVGKYLAMICSQYSTEFNQSIQYGIMPEYPHEGDNKRKLWPIYPCGLFEQYEPFLKFCKKYYQYGKKYAKEKYNIDGWLYNYLQGNISDLKHKYSNSEELNFWRVCSGWISLMLWKYYTYNSDMEYLKEIYPIINDAARAFKQMLVKRGEYYILPPSAFVGYEDAGEIVNDCSTTMQTTVYNLFRAVSKAQDILNVKNDYADLIPHIKRASAQTECIKCDCSNESMLDEYSLHIMQLTGAYDFDRCSIVKEKIANKIYKYGDLNENTSTLGWKVSLCASLHNGEKALDFLDKQLYMASKKVGIIDINDFYTRFINVNPAYAIYSNMAVCGGILNMLIHIGEDGTPELLPAIPKEWTQGKVTDVKISDNKKISFSWKDGQIENLKIENITEEEEKAI